MTSYWLDDQTLRACVPLISEISLFLTPSILALGPTEHSLDTGELSPKDNVARMWN